MHCIASALVLVSRDPWILWYSILHHWQPPIASLVWKTLKTPIDYSLFTPCLLLFSMLATLDIITLDDEDCTFVLFKLNLNLCCLHNIVIGSPHCQHIRQSPCLLLVYSLMSSIANFLFLKRRSCTARWSSKLLCPCGGRAT